MHLFLAWLSIAKNRPLDGHFYIVFSAKVTVKKREARERIRWEMPRSVAAVGAIASDMTSKKEEEWAAQVG